MPIMQLVGSVEIVKVWFKSREFVSRILNSLRECGLAFNGLDIFPYHEELPLDIVHEFYPCVGSLTLR